MRLCESIKKHDFFVVAVCIVLLMLWPGCCTKSQDPLDVIDTEKLMNALYNDAAQKGTGL
jgi:hypothetical protein